MGVGSFHDGVICPMALRDIRKGVQLAEIVRNVVLVRFASQQAVDNGDDLSAVDLALCVERAVPVAVDPAVERRVLDVFSRPIAGRNIVEAAELLHDLRITVAVHIKETDCHRGELRAGDGVIRSKDGLALTVGNAIVGEVLHIAGVPCMSRNIRELGICHRGDAIAVLLGKQSCKNRGGFRAGHAAAGAKGAVRVADDVNAVTLGLLHFGDGQLTVFVGLALFRLVQIALDGDVLILLRVLLMAGDNDRHLMLGVHVCTVRQHHCDVAGLSDRNITAGDGTLGICMDDLDGQCPAVAVRILIAAGDLAVLVGLTAAGGNSDLTRLVRFVCGIVVVLVRDNNAHVRHSGLVLDKLHGHGRLVGVVQQAAVRQTDGAAVILVECNGGIRHRIFGVGIGDGHKVSAHNGFALAVRGAAVVDFLDFCRFQLLATVLALLVLAARSVGGRLLVDDPVAGFMTGRLGVIGLGSISAAGAGVGGITHLGAGGGGHFRLVIVSQRVFQHRAALGTKLRLGAGSRSAGDVTIRGVGIQTVVATAGAVVFHHALAGAGGVGDEGSLVPAMTECIGVVCDETAAAAVAAVDGLAAGFAGSGDDMGFVIVRQRRRDVLNVTIPADGALADGVAGTGAGGSHGVGLIGMLALGGGRLLHLAAAGTQFQKLAVRITGGVADDDALPCVTEGVHIVALFDLAAVRAEIAVIAEGGAAGFGAVQQNILVVFTTALVGTAISVAILVLAAAVWIPAAAGTRTVILGGFVTEPDLRYAVLGHFFALVAVGDLVVDHVLTGFRVIGRGGHGAGVSGIAVTDSGADTGFREVADRDGVGLSVHHAVIVCNDRLCRRVVIAGVVAQAAFLHRGEASVCRLGQHFCYHAVTLQLRAGLIDRTIAETAVGATFGGDGVVGAICVLVCYALIQIFRELGSAIVQVVHIAAKAITVDAAIAVHGAAGITHCLGPVVAGVVGILTGGTIQNNTFPLTAEQSAVRVHDIAGQCRFSISGIFGRSPCGEGGLLPANSTVEGFMRDHCVDIQLICAVIGGEPVLSGVMVAVLLRRKGGGDHAHAHHQRQQKCDQPFPVFLFRHRFPP